MRYADPKRRPNSSRPDEYLDNVIRERGLVGCLSNAKWVKLLTALAANGNLVKECQVKLIWEESYNGRLLLIDEDTTYNFDYHSRAMEAMITGGPSGWYAYQEIEWLAFYRHPAGLGEQSLEEIEAVFASIGQFIFTLTDEYLRLDAYRAVAT